MGWETKSIKTTEVTKEEMNKELWSAKMAQLKAKVLSPLNSGIGYITNLFKRPVVEIKVGTKLLFTTYDWDQHEHVQYTLIVDSIDTENDRVTLHREGIDENVELYLSAIIEGTKGRKAEWKIVD